MTLARLGAWSLFAGVLAAAGLPIYIHAPKFYAEEYGVGLAALGAVLFALRLVDVVQDPALGWLAERFAARRALAVWVATLVMVLAMGGLFAMTPPVAPLLWFALMLTALFTAYSFLTIVFYAAGVARAEELAGGHVRLAGWREAGALVGVCAAAVAPVAFDGSFGAFAAAFAGVALAAGVAMRGEWSGGATTRGGLAAVTRDPLARRLLLIALVNAAPLAVTSTLFLFFVESRLDAAGAEGPLLVLFFLSAALAAPLWARLARRTGTRETLLIASGLAVGAFLFAIPLGPGDTLAFAAICVATGIALGADVTLLPAAFARQLARVSPGAGMGFGLWSFASKLTLALAAVALLPMLDRAGLVAGGTSPPEAVALLGLLYALVPVGLKLVSAALVATTDFGEVRP